MSDFIFYRVGDHYLEIPSSKWKGYERLYRMINIYMAEEFQPLVTENDEVEIEIDED